MPYKNPERKRQWEREHREERNANRRQQFANRMATGPKPSPDRISDLQEKSGWKTFIGLTVGIGIVLLAALAGISTSGGLPPSAGLGNSSK